MIATAILPLARRLTLGGHLSLVERELVRAGQAQLRGTAEATLTQRRFSGVHSPAMAAPAEGYLATAILAALTEMYREKRPTGLPARLPSDAARRLQLVANFLGRLAEEDTTAAEILVDLFEDVNRLIVGQTPESRSI